MKERLSRKGFTLVEVLTAVGLLAIVSLGIATVVQQFYASMKSTEVTVAIDSLVQRIRIAMSKESTCTANLRNLRGISMANPAGTPVPMLQYYQASGAPFNPPQVIVADERNLDRWLTVTDLRLVPVSPIGGSDMAVELRVQLRSLRGGDYVGSQSFSRAVPLVVQAPAGNISRCLSEEFNDLNQICRLSSSGSLRYSTTTGGCVSVTITRWYSQDKPEMAVCPEGSLASGIAETVCRSIPPASFLDNPVDYYRYYSDGSFRAAPPYNSSTRRALNECHCAYETSVDPTGWRCQVLCALDNP